MLVRLYEHVKMRYDNFLETEISRWMNKRSRLLRCLKHNNSSLTSGDLIGLVNIILSVAGSGETRSIFQWLSNHWGFYFLPLSLDPNPRCPQEPSQPTNVHVPKRC
jgi:hypothetical protein